MSEPYEELVDGELLLRFAPGERHEQICAHLHQQITASLATLTSTRLLARRELVQFSPNTYLRPDLALVTTATGKLWLAIEVINSEDHYYDTVTKKDLYETFHLPRLWMVDPRYNNVEVYHDTPYGLKLQGILAGRQSLTESLLPSFQFTIADLFAGLLH